MAAARLPTVNGKRVVAALQRAGFIVDRVVGSHHVMVFPGDPTRTVVIPVHAARDLKPGTMRAVIRQAGFSVDEFAALL